MNSPGHSQPARRREDSASRFALPPWRATARGGVELLSAARLRPQPYPDRAAVLGHLRCADSRVGVGMRAPADRSRGRVADRGRGEDHHLLYPAGLAGRAGGRTRHRSDPRPARQPRPESEPHGQAAPAGKEAALTAVRALDRSARAVHLTPTPKSASRPYWADLVDGPPSFDGPDPAVPASTLPDDLGDHAAEADVVIASLRPKHSGEAVIEIEKSSLVPKNNTDDTPTCCP